MPEAYAKGHQVEWNWADGKGAGEIVEVHKQKVTKTIKGSQVTRNADDDCPAYTIRQSDGDKVLKSHSEVRAAS